MWNAFHNMMKSAVGARHTYRVTVPVRLTPTFPSHLTAVLAVYSHPLIPEVPMQYVALFLFLVLFLGRCSSW